MFTYEIKLTYDGREKTVTVDAESYLEALGKIRRSISRDWVVADSKIVHSK